MIYDISQTTICHYAAKVTHARHVLRLTPINRHGQRVQVFSLHIEPEPVGRRDGADFFGNRLTWIVLESPHDRLTVRVSARVGVEALIQPAAFATPAWETVRDNAFSTSDITPMSPAQFLYPSRMVSLDPDIRDYTQASLRPGAPCSMAELS